MQTGDEERRKFIHQVLRRDFDDMLAYDFVFNTDHLSVAQVASSVLSFTSHPGTVPAGDRPQ
jgi:cytidylate kinase